MKASTVAPRWQFSLGGLFGLVTLLCLALGWLSIHRMEYTLTIHCLRMPPADDALIDWMERQDRVSGVRVTRDRRALTIRFDRRELLPTFDRLMPPLAELGYTESGMASWAARTYSPLVEARQWLRERASVSVVLVLTAVCASVMYVRWRIGRFRDRRTGWVDPFPTASSGERIVPIAAREPGPDARPLMGEGLPRPKPRSMSGV